MSSPHAIADMMAASIKLLERDVLKFLEDPSRTNPSAIKHGFVALKVIYVQCVTVVHSVHHHCSRPCL